ncbi:MAG: glutamate 5-kinase [Pseudomonadota bacterium]
MTPLAKARRIVIKTGSALIASGGEARHAWIARLAADIDALRKRGQEVILVTSGAIALGRTGLGDTRPRLLEEKQAAAALGQPLLMAALSAAFDPLGIRTAQALLTLEDTERRRRWLNARATLETLLAAGALPIINENDTVATDEIRYGDNDRLAARVAQMIGADCLILLSDVDGLYTGDPRKDGGATHIPSLDAITAEHDAMAGEANTGSGGMATKLAAAKIAYAAGCATAITEGDRDHPVLAMENGARTTWITPADTAEAARRVWLKGHLTPEGAISVDNGAVTALLKGSSLLPVGVTTVDGRFDRGAAVAINDPSGKLIAKGVSAYGSVDLEKIMGLQTGDVERILGYKGRPAVIHRDDLVLET